MAARSGRSLAKSLHALKEADLVRRSSTRQSRFSRYVGDPGQKDVVIGDNIAGSIGGMTMTLSITVDDDLGRDLTAAVAGGNRSAVIAEAIRDYLSRRNIAAAAAWHASLTGDDAAALADFDATW